MDYLAEWSAYYDAKAATSVQGGIAAITMAVVFIATKQTFKCMIFSIMRGLTCMGGLGLELGLWRTGTGSHLW